MAPSNSSTNSPISRVAPVTASSMREELRASLLKVYVLKLREARGAAATRDLLLNAGVEPTLVEHETTWISVDTARRMLTAIRRELGENSIRDIAAFVAHPEALGPWVRMVREIRTPLDAYQYLAEHAPEQTRVGEYEFAVSNQGKGSSSKSEHTVRITYKPRPEEPEESDDLLCMMREGQLAGLTTLWGLPAATVAHESCLSKGADACRYIVHWQEEPSWGKYSPLLAGGAAIVAGGIISPLGGPIAGILAALIAGALGYGIGTLLARSKKLEYDRAFERTRIATLERGLALRGDAPTPAQGELVGSVLSGKYRVGKRIGSGGIGVVHAAEHIGLGTQVAVKILRGAAAKDGSEIARLRREAQVASALDHPNVVKVYDLDTLQDGSIFIVMELLRGRSLAEKLHKDGPLAPGYAIVMFRQVCLALAAAHDLGVIHRDLKPGNVFLCEDGKTAKVLDFGMSKLAATGNEKLTQDGYTLGTPEYMAPEQCIGAPVEPRTDIYELGVLMYEALTGDLPIKSANRRELLDLHQRQIPPLMRQRRPDLPIPSKLDELIAMCLRKRVSDRPANARALERMLAEIPLDGVPMSYSHNMGKQLSTTTTRRPQEEDADPHPTERARVG